MEPCPWCVLQRLIFVAIGAFAVLGLVWRGAAGGRVAGTFALLLAVAGIAAALWQHFVAAKSASCNLTLADRIVGATRLDRLLPDVFEARASCADAAVRCSAFPTRTGRSSSSPSARSRCCASCASAPERRRARARPAHCTSAATTRVAVGITCWRRPLRARRPT
jgi:disulfide bond formation protein DsbB